MSSMYAGGDAVDEIWKWKSVDQVVRRTVTTVGNGRLPDIVTPSEETWANEHFFRDTSLDAAF